MINNDNKTVINIATIRKICKSEDIHETHDEKVIENPLKTNP